MMRALLHKTFRTAIEASHPVRVLPDSSLLERLRARQPTGSVRIIAAGKAASAMVQALEENWPFNTPPTGVAVAPDGYLTPTNWIETVAAAHPHPDARCVEAAQKIADICVSSGPDDLLVVLLSGGGSSLLSWPVGDISLETYATSLRALMAAGADIDALNTVRRHLSRLAGGKLALMVRGAPIEGLLLSDVVGDSPSLIASGPLSPDPTTLSDARQAFEHYGVNAPAEVMSALTDPLNETPKPGDGVFDRVCVETIPSSVWIAPAADMLRAEGFEVRILDEQIGGDAKELAQRHARAALKAVEEKRPIALLSGGEATTLLKGEGEGGPNAEFCLELACALNGRPDIWALACDSDGIDGGSDAAGGIITPDILIRAAASGLSVSDAISHSDSTGLLKKVGGAVVVGPTMTNVNDVRVVLVNPASHI